MKKITILLTLLLTVNLMSGQITFNWDTAASLDGTTVIETIDGITLTVSDAPDLQFSDLGFGVGTGNNLHTGPGTGAGAAATSITFTFSEPVNMKSILAAEGSSPTSTYTFTPTGGSGNTEVQQNMSNSIETVHLNWKAVTSFTVTSDVGSWFIFDDLEINPRSFPMAFNWDTAAVDLGATVTETIDGISLTVSDAPELGFGDLSIGNGNTVHTGTTGAGAGAAATSITFTFSEPVNIVSIWAGDKNPSSASTYTFTVTEGNSGNAAVQQDMSSNYETVNLDWTGVMSFTVTSNVGSWFVFDDFNVRRTTLPIVFDFETDAVDLGDTVLQIKDGITLTVYGLPNLLIGDFFTGTGNLVASGPGAGPEDGLAATNMTFTFCEPVDVVSIGAADSNPPPELDYTFSPTGGSNTEVVYLTAPGVKTVNLNWTGVTSFTVTSSGSWFMFDDLSVVVDFAKNQGTLSTQDEFVFQKAKVYPNPVENILHIKNVSELKSITIYNCLGQQVLQSKQKSIDMSHLLQGLYFLQIHTAYGMETKRVIKK